MSAYLYSEPPAYDETKYDDEPRLPSYEESCEQERLDAQRIALESERAQLILAVGELDRIRMEMEERIRKEMEERVRQEMEERIRKEMEEKIRIEMEEREQTRLRQIEEEKEAKEAKEAKQREEEDPQEIKKHNAKMVDVFMGYLEKTCREITQGHVGGRGYDVQQHKPRLTSLLASLTSRALHLTLQVRITLNRSSCYDHHYSIYGYLITTTHVFQIYLFMAGQSDRKDLQQLKPVYNFLSPLVVGSMEEKMLSKVCSRFYGHIYNPGDSLNPPRENHKGQYHMPILGDVVTSIPGHLVKPDNFHGEYPIHMAFH